MNLTNLAKKTNRKIGSALLNLALLTGSMTAANTASAYYSSRRGGGSYSRKGQSYLVDPGLAGISKDLYANKTKYQFNKDKTRLKGIKDMLVRKSAQVSELIIVDKNIKDYYLFSRLAKPGIEVIEIPKDVDGLAYMQEAIGEYKDLKAIHLFSHAQSGELVLGSTNVNAKTLTDGTEFFQTLKNTVRPGGDLLLYGCELAKGEEGEDFLEIIQNNTGLDVAASDDLTGSLDLNGDWELEIQKGDIEATPLAESIAMKDFTEVLQVTFSMNYADVVTVGDYSGSGNNAQFNENGGTNYTLTVDGLLDGTRAVDGPIDDYTYLGGSGGSESGIILSLSGGEIFDPTSLIMYSSYATTMTFASDVSGSVNQYFDGFTPHTINLSSLAATTSSITISSTFNFSGRLDEVVFASVSSANSAPTDITLAPTSINQSATGVNVVLGALSTTDADGGDFHTYSLVSGTGDTNNGSFNISGSNLRTSSALTAGTYNIRVNTNDGTDDFAEALTVTVVDNVAPTFDVAPATSSVTASGFTVGASIDEGGDIFYVVVPDGATAPTPAEVIAGTASGGGAATATGSGTSLGSPFTLSSPVAGLNSLTAYDVYVVARDDEGTPNVQAAVTKLDVTTPISNPAIPSSISIGPPIKCTGNPGLLSWSGSLNDATAWHIYTGSCGGTQIGTETGNNFIISPFGSAGPITYFIRGEGGGVTPGSCGSITITITGRENADFSYSAASYLTTDADPTPTITGVGGGSFTRSPGGLIINASTGEIDVSASTPGMYTVTYESPGICDGEEDRAVEIVAPDVTAPRITSIVRQSPTTSPTNADGVIWDVTFDEPVVNVDASDFIVTGTSASVGTVTNPSGNTYRVPVTGGDLANLNATVTLGFAGGQNIQDASTNALVNLTPTGTNNNTFVVSNPSVITLTVNNNSPGESVGSVTLTATADIAPTANLTVNLSYSGTAANGSDYTQVASITILSGQITGSANLNITSDNLLEADETIIVDIDSFSGFAATEGTPNQQTIAITDDDTATATLSVQTNGSEVSPTDIVYLVTLSKVNNTGVPITFEFDENTGSTATSGLDFTAVGATDQISVLNGSSTGTFTLTVGDDALLEANTETVNVIISGSSNGDVSVVGGGTASATITDDDTATATLSVQTNGSEVTPTDIVYLVTLSAVNNTGAPITFEFDENTGSTATSGDDFTAIGAADQISVLNGSSTGTFTLTVVDDALLEANTETVNVIISGSSNGDVSVFGGGAASATITDDDTATATLSVQANGSEVTPTDIVYLVTLSAVNNTGSLITFEFDENTGSTATSGVDFTAIGAADQISVLNGASTGTYTVTVTDDALLEANTETVNVIISGSSNGDVSVVGGGTASGTITDDDTATATLSVQTNGSEVSPTDIVYLVTLSAVNNTGSPVTFEFDENTGSTATSGLDFTAIGAADQISVANGASTGTYTVTVSDDALLEANTETVNVIISGSSNGGVSIAGGGTASATITDDDTATATLSVQTNGSEVTPTDIVYLVTLSALNDTGAPITFEFDENTGSTATSGDDFTAIGAADQISVANGSSTGTYTVTVIDDAILESSTETVNVIISGSSNGDVTIAGGGTASATITDDDAAVLSIVATTQAAEDVTNGLFTVSTSNQFTTNTNVTFTVGGTATSGTDFSVLGTSFNFPANSNSVTITVPMIADDLVEADETVIVTLTGTDNAGVTIGATDDAVVTITDNDVASLSIVATTQAAEDAASGLFTVSTTNQFSSAVTVSISVAGTATGGTDYTSLGTSFIFPANSSSATIPLSILTDGVLEANETVIVTMTSTDNSEVTVGATDNATITITDNDTASVTIADVSGNEDDGAITLTATLDNAVASGFTVDVSTLDGTATIADSDYSALTSETLTFAGTAGETQTFTVTPTPDAKVETSETLTISQGNLSGTTLGVVISDGATVTISNDDAIPAGYSVLIDQSPINSSNASAASFTFGGAESGTTYNYTLSSDGGGTEVTGSGTVATATDQVTGIDISGLGDGSITLSVTLTDAGGNIGTAATDTETKDATVPTGYDVVIDQSPISSSNASATSFTFGSAESGTTYNYTLSSDGGGTDVTGSGTVATATDQVTDIDLSGLGDGTITLSVTLTDAAGNTGTAATDTETKDATIPTGYSVGIDQSPINSSNASAASFTFGSAESGTTYNYSFSSDGGGTEVTGSGTIATATDQVTGIDLSGLGDGTVTLSVTLTDEGGNTGAAATDTAIKATDAITVALSTSANNPTNESPIEVTITFSEEVTGFEATDLQVSNAAVTNLIGSGATYTAEITPSSDGVVTVDVAADVAVGETGNRNLISEQLSFAYDSTAPVGFDTQFVDATVNALNERNVEFMIVDGEVGASYTYAITGSAASDEVTGSGTVSSDSESVFVDLSGLPNGTLELLVTLTDEVGNQSNPVTDQIVKSSEGEKIPQGFSPNGDGIDETWAIPGIEQFPNNRVSIFNRYGKVVWETTGYHNNNNAWDSSANAGSVIGSSGLPGGTYFYVVDYRDGSTPNKSGYVIIKR